MIYLNLLAAWVIYFTCGFLTIWLDIVLNPDVGDSSIDCGAIVRILFWWIFLPIVLWRWVSDRLIAETFN